MTYQYRIHVSGRVQGVWFRAGAQHKAQELGLTGFAQNRSDGSVYLKAEGSEKALQDFLHWCQQGTIAAKVEQVDYEAHQPEGFERFTVA